MAWRHGRGRIITPEFIRLSGSKDELLERVRIRCGLDEGFRRRFDGARISAFRLDDSILIRARLEDMRRSL